MTQIEKTCRTTGRAVAIFAFVWSLAVPAQAATSMAFANGWSVNNNADWTPFPPSSNPLGAADTNCTGASTPTGSWAQFTFPGLGLPAGATIDGVEVRVKYRASASNTAQLTNGGLVGATRTVPLQSAGTSSCSNTAFVVAGGVADTWGATLTAADFNAGNIGVRITQDANTVDLDAIELVVHHSGGGGNMPPTVSSDDASETVNEGAIANNTGTFSDPDGDSVTITASVGSIAQGAGTWSWSFTTSDGPDDSQTVIITADDGTVTSMTDFALTVNNVAPTPTADNAAVTVDEGDLAANTGTFSDPGADTVTITASVGAIVQGAGTWSWSFPTTDGPADSQSVTITATDSDGAMDSTNFSLTVDNVAPTVAAPTVDLEPSDEGESVTASATFSDPAGAGDSPFSCTVDYGEGDGPVSGTVAGFTCTGASHSYGDNGSYTVAVAVTDKDGDTGDADSSHEVLNVPPTVAAPTFAPDPTDEAEAVIASADFTDPGADDSPFTCELDYGEGPVAGTVTGMSCQGQAHVYGDNGSFEITVFVTDKDDGTGFESANATVDNVPPTVTLDTTGAIAFPGGAAFLGRQGSPQDHDADGDDPGSDDLTFVWDFAINTQSTAYFNDTGDPSGSADPLPSPGPTFPFSASDTGSVTFPDPGAFVVRIDLEDDDAGTDFAELAKLVTGDRECSRSQGFWRHQFKGKGKQHIDSATLQAYLDIVEFASSVFSELVPAFDSGTAKDVFAPGGSKFDKAARQALAAWLNFASGAVAVDEPIDVDGDSLFDTTFLEIVAAVETILSEPGATHADLVLAKDLAEAVNLLDEGDPACDDP